MLTLYLRGDKMFIENKDAAILQGSYTLYDFEKGVAYMLNDDSSAVYSKLVHNLIAFSSTEPETTGMLIKIGDFLCRKRTCLIYQPMNSYFDKVENWFTKELILK